MKIIIKDKYEIHVDSYGLSQEAVQAMADDVGNHLLDSLLNEYNAAVEDLVAIFSVVLAKIEEKQYNFFVVDQIIMQLLEQIDLEYSDGALLDEEIERLEKVFLKQPLNELIKEVGVN
jgi:predicted metal-dependent hydrolase